MRAKTTASIAVFLLFIAATGYGQSLDAARELYTSAEYDRALAMLDSLAPANLSREDQQTIELYRVLCLLATGKEADARGVMERLVTRNPSFRPTSDLPPRVRTVYNDTRRKLLPTAIQHSYQEAKAAYDFKDYTTAERGFAVVLEVLADPDLESLARQSPLADIRTLAAGFHELSLKAAAPPTLPTPVPRAIAPATAAAPTVPRPSTPTERASARIYSAADTNVVPPIAAHQQIPPFRGEVRTAHTGIIEVLIDTDGAVESASMVASITPQYDRMVVGATRSWRYQPARLDGAPVKFVKRIQVNLVPNN